MRRRCPDGQRHDLLGWRSRPLFAHPQHHGQRPNAEKGEPIAAPSDETPAMIPVVAPTCAPAGSSVCTKSGKVGSSERLPTRNRMREANTASSDADANTSANA